MCKTCGGMMVKRYGKEKSKCIICGREEKKPVCPFCGSIYKITKRKSTKQGDAYYDIFCLRANCLMSKTKIGFSSEEKAIEAWGTRYIEN